MVTKVGLDLGYANITLSDVTAGIYREPSIALVDKETRRIVSVGESAVSGGDGAEVDVENSLLVRPFKNGLLFDHEITKGVIEHAVKAVMPAERIRCVVGVPSDFLPKQEKELFNMMNELGVAECYFVNRAIAALIGAGYSPSMSAISVNIGAASTEIAVVYNGSIIYTDRSAVGGEDFDKAVKQYILEQGDVNVSLSVAKAIKEKLGAVWKGREESSVDIEGTLSLTGNRVRMSITDEDIVGVFEKVLHKLLMCVADAVKKIPIEKVEEIFANGIILTGGGAQLFGLDIMMSKVLGVAVTEPDDAIDCVAKGLSRINSFVPIKMRNSCKNITSSLTKYYETKKNG